MIRSNAAKLGADAHVLGGSALSLPTAGPFDLIFADPPYAPGSGTEVVEAVERCGWLAPGGWMSVETGRGDPVDAGRFILAATRDVGRARLTLLRRP